MRPDPPGRFNDDDRDRVTQLWAEARAGHGWTEVADVLVRLRAAGVPVAALAAAAGVNQERVRAVCRDHGPDPATVGDPLTDTGWITTRAGAMVLKVSWRRLQETSPDAITAGVCAMVGWRLRWHASSLPVWWGTVTPGAAEQHRWTARARAVRVREEVAAGATRRAVAAAEGVHLATVGRDLRSDQ